MPAAHQCRFAVRTPLPSRPAFLVGFSPHLGGGVASFPSGSGQAFPRPFQGASPALPVWVVPASRCVHQGGVVSDYQPILHRLRRDACGLGPTNPTRMFLPSETSGLRRTRFSRALALLIPAFALRRPPAALPSPPSPGPNAPLPRPAHGGASTVSVRGLSPVPLSARGHSTSELLRTLSRMAASKPTSWLFGRPHFLSH